MSLRDDDVMLFKTGHSGGSPTSSESSKMPIRRQRRSAPWCRHHRAQIGGRGVTAERRAIPLAGGERGDIILILDPDGSFQYANPAFERFLGFKHDDLADMNAFELIGPNKDAAARNVMAATVKQPGSVQSLTHGAQHKDGSSRLLHSVGTALLKDGAVTGVIVISRDLTEHKLVEGAPRNSERHLSLIADNWPGLIAFVDRDMHVLFANKTFESWFARPRDEIEGHTIKQVLGPESYAQGDDDHRRALAGERVHYEREISYRDGTLRIVEINRLPHKVEEQDAATAEISRSVQEASSGTQEVSANISGVTNAARTRHSANPISRR